MDNLQSGTTNIKSAVDDAIILHPSISILPKAEAESDWESILKSAYFTPTAYVSAMPNFHLTARRHLTQSCNDLSVVIQVGNKSAAIWPLLIQIPTLGSPIISSNGTMILPPLFIADLPRISQKKIIQFCFEYLKSLSNLFTIRELHGIDSFLNSISLSEWHFQMLAQGSTCSVNHELFYQIPKIESLIDEKWSSKLRNTIKKGRSLWTSETINYYSVDFEKACMDFETLHVKVSGKITRLPQFWSGLIEMVRNGSAFLVLLKNKLNEIVGGAVFITSKDEGLYAIAAYDRDLANQPLGHLVHEEAIKEFIRLQISWYKIGAYNFASDMPTPSEKDLSISSFKKQFSTHLMPSYCYKFLV